MKTKTTMRVTHTLRSAGFIIWLDIGFVFGQSHSFVNVVFSIILYYVMPMISACVTDIVFDTWPPVSFSSFYIKIEHLLGVGFIILFGFTFSGFALYDTSPAFWVAGV